MRSHTGLRPVAAWRNSMAAPRMIKLAISTMTGTYRSDRSIAYAAGNAPKSAPPSATSHVSLASQTWPIDLDHQITVGLLRAKQAEDADAKVKAVGDDVKHEHQPDQAEPRVAQ